ncbi:Scr1 family TA system antitoxin-like transcriptional regulator [Amycolatopsis sp. NPDC051758]|uniref:Scr1 family TA system antitoxin-like transcriptional regulator n=1 Tax=Amycolatopsis sp. NPDC051758 TaxID=3363935 RepID=UPI0037990578
MRKPSTTAPAALALSSSLRDTRSCRGVGLRALANKLGIRPAVLSSWELGVRVAPEDAVARILGCLQVTGPDYERIFEYARHARDTSFVDQADLHLGRITWTYEELSDRIAEWSPHAVPELLQTEAYSEKQIANGLLRPERADLELFHRQVRRQTLRDDSSRRYGFLIGEAVIRELLKSDLGTDQLDRLRHFSNLSHVTVKVVPASVTSHGSIGAFTLFENRKAPLAVVLKHHHSTTYLTDAVPLEHYQDTAKALTRHALELDRR